MGVGARVFVVDDEDAVRDSLQALLEVAGFEAQCFPSARAFLDWVAVDQIGCLLVDVRMPDIDGLELQRRVGATCPGIAVVMMTGHADVPMAVQAMKAGAVDFIEKPIAREALLAAIRRAVAHADERGRAAVERSSEEAKISSLSVRERQVLAGLVAGHPNKVIAHRLEISPRTVEIYRARLMDKMQAHSLPELIRMAVVAGVEPD
ncbi:response regulator [Vineibacter terrae]|uniref:Response regulator n=1 Tax=Vineibacter terrae TaxID=2586908 RepID=A0A5C8PF88_9HYPH|nr:response regulator FixJ [Vineibacter terrae]TXL71810.1 response regulator [Vineibacter terrae]